MDLFSKNDSERAIYLEYNGDKNKNRVPDPDEIGIHRLKKDGDFRSDECIKILKQSDIVVTNPPFSLFREYVAQLIKYKKKFIIIGYQNAISYKEIFKLIKENKMWLGYGFKGGEGKCTECKEHFELSEMEADHITPWHEGGKTIEDNCQLLCKKDNRRKSGK